MEYYLICKKDFYRNYTLIRPGVYFFGNQDTNILCIKNKKYKVEPFRKTLIVTGEENQSFLLTNKELNEYFYSKKEERNLKLKIINKIK